MIPETITRAHILEALKQIDASSIPASRQSVDYDVVHAGKRYPPKYVISIAAQYATGAQLAPDEFGAGPETNAFLTGLGFDVVKRVKVGSVGPDADLESVRAVFERLVPDQAARRICGEIFAETIEQAHAAGEARWEITLQTDLVRLNGGRVLLFDVRAQDVFLAVDPAKIDPSVKARLEEVGERKSPFAPVPDFDCYRLPHAAIVELWASLREGFRHFVAEAVLTARRCVWSRYHAPAVVEYLSSVVGRTLPQPVYGDAETEASANERGLYWVNEGKSFVAERSDPYLFARKTDAGGGTPAHWARIRDLEPGDVVVHYANGVVRALSRVRERGTEWRRSDEAGDEGWRVGIEFWLLPTPIDVAGAFGPETVRLAAQLDAERGPFDKNGKVKQGYLWDFTEDALSVLRGLSPDKDSWPAWTKTTRTRFWMFHANPDLYDVRGASRALPELTWNVKQHKSEMRVGDVVFLWESGSGGGIVAVARVLTEPTVAPQDPADEVFRKPGLKLDATDPVVRLTIERALDPIIEADDMRADPALVTLPAFSSPQRTNSSVSPAQGSLLLRWIEGKRPPRIVKVAPGDKGELWDECLAGGYVCVGWDEVGDLRQYADWSSFRKAFGAACEVGKVKGHVTNKAQELWVLARLRPGDKVVANRGISRVLGVGTVKEPGYVWDDTRSKFKHTVRVDWDTTVACEIPPHKHWGVTTVDKVPPNVVALILPELAEVDPADAPAAVARGTKPKQQPSVTPPPEGPFASLVRALQAKDSRLWFSDELVAHYVLALQAKRFAILTGVSGTGKTQLALAVAKHFQPRTRRVKLVPPPDGAVAKRVSPSIAQHRRMVLPTAIAIGLRLGGMQGTGSTTIDVEYPGGAMELSCYRDVRSTSSSVHHLSLKGEIAEWMKSLPIGDEIYFELLEPTAAGRDRLRISVPVRHEEVVTVKNYEVVAVRPDWTDGRGLLGFYNPLTRRYLTTPFLRLLLEADSEARRAAEENRSPSPFFVILDEMNLARVEQYFSDFLSALESGEPVVLHDDPRVEVGETDDEDDEDVTPIPRRLAIPPNVFFTGTVNVDETTYMFSPKVLDRAFVIEFNEVDLPGYGTRDLEDEEGSALELVGWQGFQRFRPVSADDWDALAKVDGGDVRTALARLHAILAQDNRHFGYRVANEIGRFITLAKDQCADPEDGLRDALDLAILSKVLPKLHGTQQELEDALAQLLAFTLGDGRPAGHEAWGPSDGHLIAKAKGEVEDVHEPWLPRSSLKLWRMLKRLRAQGFTSFIE